MSLTSALDDLSLEQKPLILPELPEDLKKCVFTHPLATIGKAQATFEVSTEDSKIFDYDNDAAVGHAVATACLLKLVHTKYPLLVPAASKEIVDRLLSASTLSAISDHFRLSDDLMIPAYADSDTVSKSAADIRSHVFLAYIGALTAMESAPPLCSLLQEIFGGLVEAEYENLKSCSPKHIALFTAEDVETGGAVKDADVYEAEYAGVDKHFNYIGALQEIQARPRTDEQRRALGLEYTEPVSQGADHQRMWTVTMVLDGRHVSEATSSKKKDAKNLAAGLALSKLGLLESRSSKRARTE